MNIYLPMKNDLLDKGEGTIWTGGGWKKPELTNLEGVRCAKFEGQARLRLQDTTLIKPLTVWTIQLWWYCTKLTRSSTIALSNCLDGKPGQSDYFQLEISESSIYCCGATSSVGVVIVGDGWHHVKLTSDGQQIHYYLDAKYLFGAHKSTQRFNTDGFTIGDENGDSNYKINFQGYMTQFKLSDVYNDEDLLLEDEESKFIYINQNNEVWGMA